METVDLSAKRCSACEGFQAALNAEQIALLLPQVSDWEVIGDKQLKRAFHFKDFYQTMAFVNAVAFIANQENHHPDVKLGYNYCTVHYNTHAVDGLTQNDFICAAKVDKLLLD